MNNVLSTRKNKSPYSSFVFKIKKRYWDAILNGTKKYEIRSNKKWHVRENNKIVFTAIGHGLVFGEATVKCVTYKTIPKLITFGIDKETIDFLIATYPYETEFIVFELTDIKNRKGA